MLIREAVESDLDDVLSVERRAFGSDEEANLVKALLGDPSARPFVSLVAFQEHRTVGHILFTKAQLDPEAPLSLSILAPLAVLPESQKQGIGRKLIAHGLEVLSKSGTELVFVLGYPEYYQRWGFKPAARLGFSAPYPIPDRNVDAWMVRAVRPHAFGTVSGRVICADALNKPEYWRE